jgi:ATP-binding cassette subfamily B protein
LQAKKYYWSFYFIFITYGLGVLLSDVINPLVYKNIIDLISNFVPDSGLAKNLFGFFFLMVLVMLGHQTMYRLGDYLIVKFEAKGIREIYNYTFSRILGHSYRFFSNNFSGSLVAKAKRFASSFEKITDLLSFNFWPTFVQLTGVFVVLFIKVPKVGFLLLAWMLVYVFITLFFVRKKIKYDLLEASADSKVTGRFSDAITNVLNIKIFSGRAREYGMFRETTEDEYQKRSQAWYFGNLQFGIQGLMNTVLQIAVLYLMIKLWLAGSVSAGTFVLVQVYIFGAFDHLWNLGRSMTQMSKALSEAKEMADIFNERPDISDMPNPEKCLINKGKIAFQNISFEYTRGHKVFKDFNFNIKPGEKIGLVGHSGSGKTTIVKMLLRFFDLKSGEILIDGQNIAKLRQDDLRAKISYVPQEPILFHRSIRENIAYARPEASETEIMESAQKAHAAEFILKLPQGYDTLVGERGVKLSGGERQRIAIARAMLKEAPILLLDEATSSLDSISESYIQDAFNQLMKGKTTIVIAHRLSTVQKMDRIIVLDKGKIVEEGSHQELLAKGGFYAELWNHQTGGFLK